MVVKLSRIVGVVLIAIFVALGLWSNTDKASHAAQQIVLPRDCKPTQTRHYAIEYTSSGEADLSLFHAGGSSREHRATTRIKGLLLETCIARTRRHDILALRFASGVEGSLNVDAPGISGYVKELAPELVVPFYVKRDTHRRVENLGFSDQHSPEARNVLRDLLTQSHMVLPAPQRVHHTWTTQEEDLNGVFDAHYQRTGSDSETLTIAKTRFYAKDEHEVTAQSQTHFKLQKSNGYLLEVDAYIELISRHAQQTVAHSISQLSQTLVDTTTDRKTTSLHAQAFRQLSSPNTMGYLSGKDAWRRLERNMRRSTLGTDTLATVLSRLDNEREAATTETYQKIKALIALHPEHLPELQSEFLKATTHAPAFRALLGAFVASGTPETQNVLHNAYRACVDGGDECANVLLGHFGLLEQPTTATEDLVRAVLANPDNDEETTMIARLALGNIGNSVRHTDIDRNQQIFDDLRQQYTSATEANERVEVIRALGNIGHDDLVSVLRNDLRHRDPGVRSVSYSALRFVETDDATQLLVQAITRDESERVRLESVQSMTYRAQSDATLNAQIRALHSDRSSAVRSAVLQNFSSWARDYPWLVDEIKTTYENDSSDDVRRLAEAILLRFG